jgi:hypothetical protein
MPKIPMLKLGIPAVNGRSVQLPPKQVNPHYMKPEYP